MTNQLDTDNLPLAAQRVAFALRTAGWTCFWAQAVLGVVAGLILLLAVPSALSSSASATSQTSAGTGGGVLLAVCGLLALGYSAYRAFRFTRLSKELRSPASGVRPKRAQTIQEVRLTLMSNLSGMLLTLLGAEAIGGTLFVKSISQPQVLFGAAVDFSRFIQPLDIFVVLANIHATLAHFVGIVGALWLLDRINKQ
ncbi:DUF3611 family protein [Microcoleus sp. EPA2]|uniref:DUF3611 family protein n=1 Tax=Microcoleus sp. EPA2 TaxID=2841654 RepID=UPI00312B6223